jgi:hypothetical protein
VRYLGVSEVRTPKAKRCSQTPRVLTNGVSRGTCLIWLSVVIEMGYVSPKPRRTTNFVLCPRNPPGTLGVPGIPGRVLHPAAMAEAISSVSERKNVSLACPSNQGS